MTGAAPPATGFSGAQYDDAYPPGVESSFWHVARNAIIAEELERAGMSGDALLEIGCGRGIVVGHLRQLGLDCVGCDLATPAVPLELRPYVQTGFDFRDLHDQQRARLRGVLLCDVLEHLADPSELLRQVRESLPNVRSVLVTVPARRELWSQWDEHFGHFRRYDLDDLASDLRRGGLEPTSMRYFFHALYAPMLAARGKRRDTTIAAPALPLAHKLLGRAFALEGRLLPPWLPGTSIIAVARV